MHSKRTLLWYSYIKNGGKWVATKLSYKSNSLVFKIKQIPFSENDLSFHTPICFGGISQKHEC